MHNKTTIHVPIMVILRQKWRTSMHIVPFKNEGKGCDDKHSNDMTVNRQNIVTHAMVQRDQADDIHASITKLQGHHGQVRFHLVHCQNQGRP